MIEYHHFENPMNDAHTDHQRLLNITIRKALCASYRDHHLEKAISKI